MALPEPDFAADASAVLAKWRGTASGNQGRPVERDGRGRPEPGHSPDQSRCCPGLRRSHPAGRRGSTELGPVVSDGVRTGRPGSSTDPRDPGRPREPGLFSQEPDLLLYVAQRERWVRRQAERARYHGGESRQRPPEGDGVVRRRRARRAAHFRARKSVAARRPCASAVLTRSWPARIAGRSRAAAAGWIWRWRSRRPRIRSPPGSLPTGSGCTTSGSRWCRLPATSARAARPRPTPSCSTTWRPNFSERAGRSRRSIARSCCPAHINSRDSTGPRAVRLTPRIACSGGFRGDGSTWNRCATPFCSCRAGSTPR